MSDWKPKVGDKVMVGEHGPYEVLEPKGYDGGVLVELPKWNAWVDTAWLTPAPEPEPEEPTAPGAVVRDGAGNRWHRVASRPGPPWMDEWGMHRVWQDILRPITVILADPAEVETLRAEVDGLREDVKHAEARADELQWRIDKALALTGPRDKLYDTWLTQGAILRGEQ